MKTFGRVASACVGGVYATATIVANVVEYVDDFHKLFKSKGVVLSDLSFLPVNRTRKPVLLNCDVLSDNCVNLKNDDVVDALCFWPNAWGWKLREKLNPKWAYSEKCIVLVPPEERVGHADPRPWKRWQGHFNDVVKNLDSRGAVVCAGRAPLAVWMYLGQILPAQEVVILNFPFRQSSAEKPQVFHVKGGSALTSKKLPVVILRSEKETIRKRNSSNTFFFVSLEPSKYKVTEKNLQGDWEVLLLRPLTSNGSVLVMSDDFTSQLVDEISKELGSVPNDHLLAVSTSGPDALAFILGLHTNAQKVKSIAFYEYVRGEYEPSFSWNTTNVKQ